jgi:hypothetical protein
MLPGTTPWALSGTAAVSWARNRSGESGTASPATPKYEGVHLPVMDDADRRAVIRAAVPAGAGLTVVGAFLPWVVASTLGVSVSRSGIEADGTATLVLAAVAIANARSDTGIGSRWRSWGPVAPESSPWDPCTSSI